MMVYTENHNHKDEIVYGKKLITVTVLNLLIAVVQIIGGTLSNSLSLLSDALHNLGDSSGLLIAFIANKISRRKPDTRRTFGYKRVEILAALFNGIVLIALCIFLFGEAYRRFVSPERIKSGIMLGVALFGLAANLLSTLILRDKKDENLNIRAAYLHLLGDTLSSVAVISGGIIMWSSGFYWIDPIISAFIGVYIIYHTWDIVKESVDILLQSSPAGIDIQEIKKQLELEKEIDNIHHIHIWRLNDSQVHFEAHINLKRNINVEEMMGIKNSIEKKLKGYFHISHTTLQFGYGCCPDNKQIIVDA